MLLNLLLNDMTSKQNLIILFLIFAILPTHKIHAQNSNTGFVPGNIWYSVDPFEEGDKIKIYTLIFNLDARELSGTVVFFDNSVFLGKKNFIVPAKGVKDVFIDWTATVGTHNIFGKIENAKFLISKEKYEEVYLVENETSKSSRIVNKKIILKTNNTEANPNLKSSVLGLESINNIRKIIGENTPEFVAKPIILGINMTEGLRSDMNVILKNKKEAIKNEIELFNKDQTSNKIGIEENRFLKPLKYTELFFLTFLSFVLNNKFIFYPISILIIFIVIKYIRRLFFF